MASPTISVKDWVFFQSQENASYPSPVWQVAAEEKGKVRLKAKHVWDGTAYEHKPYDNDIVVQKADLKKIQPKMLYGVSLSSYFSCDDLQYGMWLVSSDKKVVIYISSVHDCDINGIIFRPYYDGENGRVEIPGITPVSDFKDLYHYSPRVARSFTEAEPIVMGMDWQPVPAAFMPGATALWFMPMEKRHKNWAHKIPDLQGKPDALFFEHFGKEYGDTYPLIDKILAKMQAKPTGRASAGGGAKSLAPGYWVSHDGYHGIWQVAETKTKGGAVYAVLHNHTQELKDGGFKAIAGSPETIEAAADVLTVVDKHPRATTALEAQLRLTATALKYESDPTKQAALQAQQRLLKTAIKFS